MWEAKVQPNIPISMTRLPATQWTLGHGITAPFFSSSLLLKVDIGSFIYCSGVCSWAILPDSDKQSDSLISFLSTSSTSLHLLSLQASCVYIVPTPFSFLSFLLSHPSVLRLRPRALHIPGNSCHWTSFPAHIFLFSYSTTHFCSCLNLRKPLFCVHSTIWTKSVF